MRLSINVIIVNYQKLTIISHLPVPAIQNLLPGTIKPHKLFFYIVGLITNYGTLRAMHTRHQASITLADLVALAAVEAALAGMRGTCMYLIINFTDYHFTIS